MMDDFILLNQLCHPLGMASCIVINATVSADRGPYAFDEIEDMAR